MQRLLQKQLMWGRWGYFRKNGEFIVWIWDGLDGLRLNL